jgi:predicted nucleic acid-binding protein
VTACKAWAGSLAAAGHRLFVPEIADYELRRELLRLGGSSVPDLDALAVQFAYLPLTTAAMRKAAELWAAARQGGYPMAPDPALDCDVVLAAQALTVGDPNVVIATGNPAHLSRYAAAERWDLVKP